MFVTLLAVVVALVLGHLAPALAASVRRYDWYRAWLRWLDEKFPHEGVWRGRFGIALALLPPLLAVALFQLALDTPIYGLAGLLFAIAILFYVWGPRDLDRDVDAIVEAADGRARAAAAARLWPSSTPPTAPDAPALVEAVFRCALRRWFGVLFWFLLLGPFGALLYRLTALAAEDEAGAALPAETRAGARRLLALLDWPVAQLATFSLALVGDFDVVVGAWKEHGGATLRTDADFLAAAGRASVRSELADEAEDYLEDGLPPSSALVRELGPLAELRDAMSLVWRTLLLWLAIIALFVIGGWVS